MNVACLLLYADSDTIQSDTSVYRFKYFNWSIVMSRRKKNYVNYYFGKDKI